MSLPEDREELRRRIAAGESFDFYFFYGHKPPESGVDASCLSQWFVRVFRIEDIDYPTAEHWMMAEKARLFGDDEMLAEILVSEGPKDAKALGRKVRGFDNETWNEYKYRIVKRGNYEKFTQHDDLKAFLISTAKTLADQPHGQTRIAAEETAGYQVSGDQASQELDNTDEVREQIGIYQLRLGDPIGQSNVILVEAAGRDTIWGIGLGKNNPKSLDPFKWRGQNLLGFALTAVRDQIIAD